MSAPRYKRLRWLTRSGFFVLFVLAPPLDLFRLDLNQGHFYFLGMDWTLGLTAFQHGEIGPGQAVANLLLRGFLPIALVIGVGGWVAWRYGRLYCGWLCPHFSVVETINHLMLRASGKPSLWEHKPLPILQADGRRLEIQPVYWLWTLLAALGFAFLWAVSLLTYLLPPVTIYHNLLHAELTRNQGLFIGIATLLFSLEFLLARHLFCRFGCAIGFAQSVIWMANPRAMVVSFDKARGTACKDCVQACDNTCPMRLKPRKNKRHMFTCTQCSACLQACDQVMRNDPPGLLHFASGQKQAAWTSGQREKP
ncbi:MAG TPA: 4Fe-4S binding protein [Thiotrichales bacterium]|nr:4Fe-4S binding protein [Thiotrichales bacterium]